MNLNNWNTTLMMLMMVVILIFVDVGILVVFDPATCVHQINLGGVEYMTGDKHIPHATEPTCRRAIR